MTRIQNALISVSDKSGLATFAKALVGAGVDIFSTGGTRAHLEEAGIPVQDISAYTGFPEMMDGRLKTLHPKVFGGILARRDRGDDLSSLRAHDIRLFDLVVVNLYPFEATVADPDCTFADAIEKIDIGGPSLVRAAAKNQAFVTIVTDPKQYAQVATEIMAHGATELETRKQLAVDAFRHTAKYDRAITGYFDSALCRENEETSSDEDAASPFDESIAAVFRLITPLRYGENPHQQAALYSEMDSASDTVSCGSVVAAKQLHGKALSYNNYLDLDSALAVVRGFESPTVSVIKHNNPCGVASSDRIEEALQKALDGDPTSAFGSILGFNRNVTAKAAETLATPGLFVEAIVAPAFEPEAIEILTTKPKWKMNVRLMEVGPIEPAESTLSIRPIAGGALVQEADDRQSPYDAWEVVTEAKPDAMQISELRFAWEVVRHVRSNAIAVCRNTSAVGVGAGQMSRVDAVEIAIRKAGERTEKAVLASDAFFPFPDSIETAAAAGITAVVQPGGSKNDNEVISACDRLGLKMVFTGQRHFKH